MLECYVAEGGSLTLNTDINRLIQYENNFVIHSSRVQAMKATKTLREYRHSRIQVRSSADPSFTLQSDLKHTWQWAKRQRDCWLMFTVEERVYRKPHRGETYDTLLQLALRRRPMDNICMTLAVQMLFALFWISRVLPASAQTKQHFYGFQGPPRDSSPVSSSPAR